MSFTTGVLERVSDLPAGEVIEASPYNVSAYEVFENGLVQGCFAKFESGSVDSLDGSAAPTIAGVAKRKVTGEIGPGVYSTSGQAIDSVAEIIDFGQCTVSITDAATPTKFDPVYVINAAGADAGKITQDSGATGALLLEDVVFWEVKASGVWLVRIKKYL